MLVQDSLLPDTPSSWTGIAGVLQCFFVLSRYVKFLCIFLWMDLRFATIRIFCTVHKVGDPVVDTFNSKANFRCWIGLEIVSSP